MESIYNSYMFSFLSTKTLGTNPFEFSSTLKEAFYKYPKTPTDNANNIEDIRRSICLGLVIGITRPDSCNIIFCRYFMKKSERSKKLCPYCKRSYEKLVKVNLEEKWISNVQMDIFV